MKKIIIANTKMNILPSNTKKYINNLENINNINDLIVLLPYVDLPYAKSNKIKIGSQNIFYKNNGAYTGEISIDMIKDLNINYVLIGHYERKKYFKETNKLIKLKYDNLVKNNFNIILCVNSIKDLKYIIKDNNNYDKLIIAYEDNNCIGTTNILDPNKIIKFIKNSKKLTNNKSKVIYGGGININNIDKIKNIKELDGILVGKASLDINNFSKIIESYNK